MTIYNTMEGDISLIGCFKNEFEAEAIIGTSSYLDGEVNILNVKNHCLGKIEVLPLPKVKMELYPIHDTYTRSDYSTYSFGSNESLYVGNLNGKELKSFIKFNTNDIPKNVKVVGAKIILQGLESNSNLSVNLYSVNKSWQENNTTWNNQPTEVDLIAETLIPGYQKSAEFDVFSYVSNCYTQQIIDNGLLLKAVDATNIKQFYSKESSYAPILEVEYIDYNIANIETTHLDGEVSVYRVDNKYINGEVTVNTTITVEKKYLDSEVIISKEVQYGEITVVPSNNQEAEVTVSHRDLSSIEGEIIISKPEQVAEVSILALKELEGEITVNKKGNNSLDAIVSIIKNEATLIDGEVEVVFEKTLYSTINGEIIIIKNDSSLIDGEVEVVFNKEATRNFEGDVIVKSPNELEAEIYVNQLRHINGEVFVGIPSYEYLEAEVDILCTNSFEGDIIIKSPNELEAEVSIQSAYYKEAEVNVILPGYSDIEGEIEINASLSIGYCFIL